MGWFWPGPSWKPARAVKPACLRQRRAQPGSGTASTGPPPPTHLQGWHGVVWAGWGGLAVLGGLLGLAQLGPFLSNPRGFPVLPREARGPHVQATCPHRRQGPFSTRPGDISARLNSGKASFGWLHFSDGEYARAYPCGRRVLGRSAVPQPPFAVPCLGAAGRGGR